jgi:hypothetical protein
LVGIRTYARASDPLARRPPRSLRLSGGGIKAADLPRSFPEFQIVEVFRRDATVRSLEELCAEIFGQARRGHGRAGRHDPLARSPVLIAVDQAAR